MFKKKLFLFILFLAFSVKSFSQQFYACDSNGKLALITLTNSGPQYQYLQGCGTYFSIAISGNKLYYIDSYANLFSADITTGATPTITNCTLITTGIAGDALTVDTKGLLYYVNGYQLYSVNPNSPNPTSQYLGTMPYSAAGDVAFYNNQLYMAAPEGIVTVNLSNPALSTLSIPMYNVDVFGLANVLVNGVKTLYALDVNQQANSTSIIQLDMQNMTQVGSVGTVPFVIYDAGSATEAGVVQRINIVNFTTTQECNAYNQASVAIVCSPGTNQYTFTLGNGQSNTTGTFDNLPPGTYNLTIKSNGPEIPTDTAFVIPDYTVNSPAITETQINPVCNNSGQIKLDVGASDALYSIAFQNSVYGFDHIFTGLSTGTYSFTILNKSGCIIDQKSYYLPQDPCVSVVIDSINVTRECNALNKGQVKIVCEPNTDQFTFTLGNGQSNTTGIFDNLLPGTYQLNVTSNGGQFPTNTTFIVPDFSLSDPIINATLNEPICNLTGTIKLDAGSADAAYRIQYNNNTFGFDNSFTGLTAGTYHFTIVNTAGCIIEEKDYVLTQNVCPPITIGNIDVAPECTVYGQASITITTQPHPDQYTYTLNNVSDTTGVFDFVPPGTYNLVITSSGGDKLEQQVIVPDYTLDKPDIALTIKSAECELPGSVKISANGDSKGAATIKHGTDVFPFNSTINNLKPGINYFNIFNGQGCIIDTLAVNIPHDECFIVSFPNAFTPNGDGINDVFRANQNSNPIVFKLFVYDRWGSLVFQSKSVFDGWDGTVNNNPAPFGVYYYVASFTMPDNKSSTKSGYVTLIR
ncbi:gliding motility-associated-like protein [Mucilaginibacter frigoritolerans]|uniref:Gliding motility-associated-like protein n=1 Tax=Mucilaginibacter frigoritolerans TaxID=652788 RepID=A0A562UGQ6_9SPHI|nr:gliding motility-associated-like protein [Mucilaginibacter frigoritolerans]